MVFYISQHTIIQYTIIYNVLIGFTQLNEK